MISTISNLALFMLPLYLLYHSPLNIRTTENTLLLALAFTLLFSAAFTKARKSQEISAVSVG